MTYYLGLPVLIFTLTGTAGSPALATQTDDPMYDSAEEKAAIQCLHRANSARLDVPLPFEKDYFLAACKRLIDTYTSMDKARSDQELQKTFDYFRWQDDFHHIR